MEIAVSIFGFKHIVTERSTTPILWTDQCQQSFDLLRNLWSSPPIHSYPDLSRAFILDTDASNGGIGVLFCPN